jgi:hypothetical protein
MNVPIVTLHKKQSVLENRSRDFTKPRHVSLVTSSILNALYISSGNDIYLDMITDSEDHYIESVIKLSNKNNKNTSTIRSDFLKVMDKEQFNKEFYERI